MNTRVTISIVLLSLGVIIAAVPQNTTKPYKLTAEELLQEAYSKDQFISPDQVAKMIVEKDPSLQLIDVRTPDEFDKYHLPGSINIPLTDLLSEEWEGYIDQDVVMNVFYSNGTLKANEAWMITRQLGYLNNYVLQGGMNYWAETILNPQKPDITSPDEEIARYNFRKGAGMALGGNIDANMEQSTEEAPIPKVKKRPKRKRVAGGC
jgi:rhodanese-related sulfurtransferase